MKKFEELVRKMMYDMAQLFFGLRISEYAYQKLKDDDAVKAGMKNLGVSLCDVQGFGEYFIRVTESIITTINGSAPIGRKMEADPSWDEKIKTIIDENCVNVKGRQAEWFIVTLGKGPLDRIRSFD